MISRISSFIENGIQIHHHGALYHLVITLLSLAILLAQMELNQLLHLRTTLWQYLMRCILMSLMHM